MADSTSIPQLHLGLIVSWKLRLNLCSQRLQRPRRTCVIYLLSIGLWESKNELEEDCVNFNVIFENSVAIALS